jgi:uncharacterized protein (TIGR00255 family)
MTGYGKASAEYNGKKITAEIKSVNSKAMDLQTRIAPIYREKEMELRSLISTTLERGKVDFSLYIERDDANAATPINRMVVKSYIQQIRALTEDFELEDPEVHWIPTLLRLPDVLTRTDTVELSEEEWTVARSVAEKAIHALMEFRRQEGAALQKKFAEKMKK